MVDLDQLVEHAKQDFAQAKDPAALEDIKAKYFGKSGILTEMLKGLGKLDPELRKTEGARINHAKSAIEHALQEQRQLFSEQLLQTR